MARYNSPKLRRMALEALAAGESPKDVAAGAGVSVATISRWRKDQRRAPMQLALAPPREPRLAPAPPGEPPNVRDVAAAGRARGHALLAEIDATDDIEQRTRLLRVAMAAVDQAAKIEGSAQHIDERKILASAAWRRIEDAIGAAIYDLCGDCAGKLAAALEGLK